MIDNNALISYLPMQKVALRPKPVFMGVSGESSVSGDSLGVRKNFAPRVSGFSNLVGDPHQTSTFEQAPIPACEADEVP
jgi:hypothetical protein